MNAPVPVEPLVFLKPVSAICYNGDTVQLPSQSTDVHHEVELVVAIRKTGKNISVEEAHKYVAGYGIGIDFTARDLQKNAKEKGQPWSVAKGFDHFAPISNFQYFPGGTSTPLEFQLSVNGKVMQMGTTTDMIFSIDQLIAYLSSIFTLNEGDLIFTGTPEGVGPVQPGDRLMATIKNFPNSLTVYIK